MVMYFHELEVLVVCLYFKIVFLFYYLIINKNLVYYYILNFYSLFDVILEIVYLDFVDIDCVCNRATHRFH